jgi:4-alpha-glucanotransferase
VKFPRCSGILLHITSLPGQFGIGDLGPAAYAFADFLAGAGMKLWQVLPLNPTGYGDSPYQCFSAFAGNPLLLSIEDLRDQGVLEHADLASSPVFSPDEVQYGRVIEFKFAALRRAAEAFFADASSRQKSDFEGFCRQNSGWLADYAVFMACKDHHGGAMWTSWDSAIRDRNPSAIMEWTARLTSELHCYQYWQFQFFRQWEKLKTYCLERGIQMMGDIPIYVAHDSADVWSHKDLFQLDEAGNPTCVSGVPPDYFSVTGQLWGNPIYRWDRLAETGYRWWIDRFRGCLTLFDVVRLDHFRGFEAYWEVPAGETTAIRGRWVKGPGAEFLSALQSVFGDLPIVAENLGVITPGVEELRQQFGLPGMCLLQFAFGNDPQGPSFRPHNYIRSLVAYTGGHDNDTTGGWWSGGVGDSTRSVEDIRKEHDFTKKYLGFDEEPIQWVFIRAVLASVADIAIIPLQDVLGLGTEARMNLPGRMSGNWKWRFEPAALTDECRDRLYQLNKIYDR